VGAFVFQMKWIAKLSMPLTYYAYKIKMFYRH
jgi:hypothetical protein